ncbi:MAG: DUF1707 domain-containing protein [Pseudonocardia sp.]|uniref:DUF1707 SHOCT-like domain-containing protein n=1 Tax=unclassified Pseudonocardia TaxID=2619320 RepID=UPI00086A002D|nr:MULTISPECIES: DUF1707 domain-containing protein [unclassified Pseudonocardia]MBN9107697.1 DUF1707 domain-containing protein [Pseudonocardia sp.]ODV01222.1 MAG: hypothetical protein ABT15_27785 [Pseudonocardia sp. SCN 73-27]
MSEHTARPGLRVGDAERERTEALLRTHVGAGRLDLPEFESRLDAVHAAHTQADLDAVTRDLPAPARAARPARAPRNLQRAAMWAPWAAVGAICMVVWLATSLGTGAMQPFWPVWVIGPWGAVLVLGTLTGRHWPCATTRARS